MKLSRYFFMVATAMMLFACSDDNNDGLDNKKGNMTLITLSLGKAESRALNEMAGGKYNNVNSLRLEFFASDGRNLNVPQPDFTEAIKALQTAHQATIAVENVPLTAKWIEVIANEKDVIQTGTWNDILKSTVTLKNMYDSDPDLDFNQQNSLLTGIKEIPSSGTDGEPVMVNVDIKPVSSRLEIGKFTAKKKAAEEGQTMVNIKSFEVKGIFINQFYTESTLDPEKNPALRLRVEHGSDKTKYSKAHYAACSIDGGGGMTYDFSFMCDDYTDGYGDVVKGEESEIEDVAWEVAPVNSSSRWGYPVLAGKERETDNVYDVANIVIKLHVFWDSEDVEPEEKYITVVGYKRSSNHVPVTKFTRGEVYCIENLVFDVDDLTDVPYEGNRTVNAIVRVLPWEAVSVTPDIQ